MTDLLADMQRRIRMRHIPGLSIRVAQHGNVLFNSDLGVSDLFTGKRLTSSHRFRIGCLTKPVVAHAVLRLVARGDLALDRSIGSLIPALAMRPEFRAITVYHLLSHTSGLARGPYDAQGYSDEDTLQRIRSSLPLFKPGEHFKYSNWGYHLLGKVIERITGDAADQFIAKTIFAPLGMCRSGFSDDEALSGGELATGYWKGWYFGSPDLSEPSVSCPPIPLLNAAGGMISTADDYLRWLTSLLREKESATGLMLVGRHAVRSNYAACLGVLMEQIDDVPFYYFSASNSGFSGLMLVIPALGLAGVALCNQSACNNELREILYRVCVSTVSDDGMPRFGRGTEHFDVFAGNRASAVHFKGDELVRGERRIQLYPYSRSAYFVLGDENRRHMLRIRGLGNGDAVITVGDQVYYEKPIRLRQRRALLEPRSDLAGVYRHAAFGRVEVIDRDNRLYLSYGAAYEPVLQPIGELRFKQGPGAFCFEEIAFRKDSGTGEVVSFALNDMVFQRAREAHEERV